MNEFENYLNYIKKNHIRSFTRLINPADEEEIREYCAQNYIRMIPNGTDKHSNHYYSFLILKGV